MSGAAECDVGVLGLGVMGSHLARNFASRGFRVAGYEREVERGRALAAEHPEAKLVVAETLQQFVNALLGLAGVCLVAALMRPQWGLRFEEAPRAGAEIMICLDVSRSMLAEDAVPNRLERAKAEVVDLLPMLDGDHVGLTAFAGYASVVCPMTPDFGFLRPLPSGQ